jgi:hypothetical protein
VVVPPCDEDVKPIRSADDINRLEFLLADDRTLRKYRKVSVGMRSDGSMLQTTAAKSVRSRGNILISDQKVLGNRCRALYAKTRFRCMEGRVMSLLC